MRLLMLLACFQDWSIVAAPVSVDWSIEADPIAVVEDAPLPPEKPMLHIWSLDQGCPGCDALKRDLKAGLLYGTRITWERGTPEGGYPRIEYEDQSWVGWNEQTLHEVRVATGLEVEAFPVSTGDGDVTWLKPTNRPGRYSFAQEPKPIPQTAKQVTMSHAEMKALHDKLHGGGSWTWPGDLAEHLRTVHGVSTTRVQTTQQPAVTTRRTTVQYCPSGNCPTPTRQRRGLLRNLFR